MKINKGTFYGNRSIEFRKFPYTADSPVDANTELTLGHFLQEIALNCQVKYGCDQTVTTLYPAAYYLRDIGYSTDIIKGGIDRARFIRYLQAGWPHIMSGDNSNGVCHAWILDGAIEADRLILYHINWGYGTNHSNGWSTECYYGEIQNSTGTYEVNFYKSHCHLYLTL